MDEVTGNVDLLAEILIRVPTRSLVRFKSVSQNWLSLMSDPKFCHRHTLQNPRPAVSGIFPQSSHLLSIISLHDLAQYDVSPRRNPSSNSNDYNSSSKKCMNNPLKLVVPNHHLYDKEHIWCKDSGTVDSVHDDGRDGEVTTLQSCNGLFLCLTTTIHDESQCHVLNPTTNKFSTLVFASSPSSSKWVPFARALAFDPSSGSPHYKLLIFSFSPPSEDIEIQEYSSKTKTWRLVDTSHVDPTGFRVFLGYSLIGGVYCNGALHWVGLYRSDLFYYHVKDERVGFVVNADQHDPVVNTSHTRCLPRKSLHVSHRGTRLNLIEYYYSSCIKVMEMKRDYSGLCIKYTARIDARVYNFTHFTVLCLADPEGDDNDDVSLLIHTPGQVLSCNLKSNVVKCFELTPMHGVDDSELRVYWTSYPYTETLACV